MHRNVQTKRQQEGYGVCGMGLLWSIKSGVSVQVRDDEPFRLIAFARVFQTYTMHSEEGSRRARCTYTQDEGSVWGHT